MAKGSSSSAKTTRKSSRAATSQPYTDKMYHSYGVYSLLQVAVGIYLAYQFDWALPILCMAAFFAVVAWVFFSKQPYAKTVANAAASFIGFSMVLSLVLGRLPSLGDIVGTLVYASFGVRVPQENNKGEGSVIFSGDEASDKSLLNYGLLIGFIVVVIFGIWLWFKYMESQYGS